MKPIFALILFCVIISCKDNSPLNGHDFVNIPGGEYTLGGKGNHSNPLHKSTIKSFEMATTETTNTEFKRFVDATGYVTDAEKAGFAKTFQEGDPDWEWRLTNGACWKYPFGPENGGIENKMNYPVTQISCADAKAYCKWLGVRLPTKDEWEVAARGGMDTKYPWGDSLYPDGKAMCNIWQGTHSKNELKDGFMYTAPVKSFPPNKYGLYDVIGNVFEYCNEEIIDTLGTDTLRYSTGRGGSWWCSENTCNSFNLVQTGRMPFHESICNQGFRVARDIKE